MTDFSKLRSRPDRATINQGLTSCKASTLHNLFGKPGQKSQNCSDITNASLRAMLEVRNVGPFKVYGLKLLVDQLEMIFAEVRDENSELYNQLKYFGMSCCRAIRGGSNFSNHSWGSAIDISCGDLDAFNDGKTQLGMSTIYPYFHKRGWYWGAGFSREDSMHFEASNELIQRLYREGIPRPGEVGAIHNEGFIATPPGLTTQYELKSASLRSNSELNLVAKGKLVLLKKTVRRESVGVLQDAFNSLNNLNFVIDLGAGNKYRGFFGPKTEVVVKAFQTSRGLSSDGIVGEDTIKELDSLMPDQVTATHPISPTVVNPPIPIGIGSNDYDPPQSSIEVLGSIPVTTGKDLDWSFLSNCEAVLELKKDNQTAIFIESEMATDADGSPRVREIDPRWGQLKTSFSFPDGSGQKKYPDAEKIRYYVLPGTNSPASNRFYRKIGAKLGDVAAVIYQGRVSFAFFADVGPTKKIGEGSIALSESLGFDPWGIRNGNREIIRGISSGVIYLVFPGSNSKLPRLTPENANREVAKLGKKLFKQLGGKLP